MKRIILCLSFFAFFGSQAQQINPVPDYVFRNQMSVGRNAVTDTAAYISIGPRYGANKGLMPPIVSDTAAITGVKRNGLLIFSVQRNNFQYWDSINSRWTSVTANVDTTIISTRAWRKKGDDSLGAVIATRTDTTLLSTRAWRQKGLDSLAAIEIDGSGTVNYVPKFTASRTLGNSTIFESSGGVSINTTNVFSGYFLNYNSNVPAYALQNPTSGIGAATGYQLQLTANNAYTWNYQNGFNAFGTNNTERLRIFANGRVGVNTTTDAGYQFDVAGSMRNTTDAYFATSSGRVGVGTTSPTEELHVIANVDARDGIKIANSNTGNSSIASLILNSPNTTWNIDNNRVGGRFSIVNVSNEVLTLTTGRNMGLNVSNPLSNTGVAGSVFHIDSPSDTISSIHLTNSHIGSGLNRGMNIESHKSDAVVWNGSNGFMDFGTNNTRRMRIFANGVVGINTTTDAGAFQLQVNGVARASDGLATGNPNGGTAATWKLGTVATVTPTSPNRTIEVEIGGTTYYIHAKTTNN